MSFVLKEVITNSISVSQMLDKPWKHLRTNRIFTV